MRNIDHQKTELNISFPQRSVFADGGGEKTSSAPIEVKKKPDEKKSPEQKAGTFTVDDLKKARTDAQAQLILKIGHPEIQKDAIGKLSSKLDPLQDQLSKLETEKNDERLKVKADVEKAVKEVLEAKYTFKDMTVQVAGNTYRFEVNPARTIDKYDELLTKSTESVTNADRYYRQRVDKEKTGTVDKNSLMYMNGVVSFTIQIDRTLPQFKNNAEDAYIVAVVNGNKIEETYSNSKLDEAKVKAGSFLDAFKIWQESPDKTTSFTYGNPPKQCDLSTILKDGNSDKSSVTVDLLQKQNGLPAEVAALNDPNLIEMRMTTYVDKKGGKVVTETNSPLHPERVEKSTLEMNERKELMRTREYDQVVNQQKRHIKTVTEYWPIEPGQKEMRLKKQETYEDGVVTGEAKFDKKGELVERISHVRGCEGITAVDTPTKNGKKIALLDDEGKAIVDENGRALPAENETGRVMIIKTKEGKEVRIASLEAMKKLKGSNYSTDDYMKFIAENVKTKEQFHAFTQLMFKYRSDKATHGVEDYWQSSDETAKKTENGMMLGDCEDYAFFIRSTLQLQGKKAYVLRLPGHAECVTISKDKNGKFHATSYGTFGVDEDGNRVGEKADEKKSAGYDTPEQALKSLQEKWHVKNSGNEDMGDGSLTHGPFMKVKIMRLHFGSGKLPPGTDTDGEFAPEEQSSLFKRININANPGDLEVNIHEEPEAKTSASTKPTVKTVEKPPVPKPAVAPATAVESPETVEARNKILPAGRSVLTKYVGSSYADIIANPDLAGNLRSDLLNAAQQLNLGSVTVRAKLPGNIVIDFKKGAISISGTEDYAKMVIRKKKEINDQNPPSVV